MGHAAHFLRRLDRLDDPHVELALRLYNDPELLGATLKRAKLPEGAERLAIALEDPRDGPFIVVTREGRFVTCLGRGMSPGDRPIVTREQLDAAARHVERMRETLAQARFFDANEGLLRKKFKALYDDGPYVSREQIEDIARWEPLLGATLLSACFGTSTDLLDTRALVKNITRPHPRHEEILRRYYETFYACSHLFVLAGISPASRALMSQLAEKHPVVTWAWTGVRHGVGYLLYRALWSTARMGKILMPGQKRRLRSELTFLGTIDAMLGTGILGLAHEKLRAEARKALRAPRKPMEGDPRIGPVGNLLQAVFEVCFDSPEAADEAALNLGRHFFERFAPWLPERYRFERPEDIPPELARALHVSVSDPILIDADRISAAFFILPWLARAEATELYLPADIVDALRRPWSMESTIRLLEMPRREDGVRAPRRVEKTPGRNDPCPCKSGKKYKRCCGAAGVKGGG